MKYYFIGAGIGCLIAALVLQILTPPLKATIHYPIRDVSIGWTLTEPLVQAIGMVESGGRADAINHVERAYGIYQIRETTLRALGFKRKDALDPARALWIMRVYFGIVQPASDEEAARMWNGGENGMKKHSTLRYWYKIQKEMTYEWITIR